MRATQFKYRRVNQPREQQTVDESELKISTKTRPSIYIRRGIELFEGDEQRQVKAIDTLTITALGNAISRALMVNEIIRRRVKGVYEYLTISNTEVKDVFEPIEKGLDVVTQTKVISMLTIKLTKKEPTSQDRAHPGFQEPISDAEVEKAQLERDEQQKNRSLTGGQQRRYGPRQTRGGNRGGYGGERRQYRREGGDRDRDYQGGSRKGDRRQNYDNRRDNREEGGERRQYNKEGGERRQQNNREGGERRQYDNKEGSERRQYNNREGGDRRQYNNRDEGERRQYNNRDEGEKRQYNNNNRDGGDRRDTRPRQENRKRSGDNKQ